MNTATSPTWRYSFSIVTVAKGLSGNVACQLHKVFGTKHTNDEMVKMVKQLCLAK